jgi:hypothetical protein
VHVHMSFVYKKGWPKGYAHTMHDRIYGHFLLNYHDLRRVDQNRKYAPYMTVYLVIFLPKTPYIHRIYIVLANPRYTLYTRTCVRL